MGLGKGLTNSPEEFLNDLQERVRPQKRDAFNKDSEFKDMPQKNQEKLYLQTKNC
jgi:hypothetical protein